MKLNIRYWAVPAILVLFGLPAYAGGGGGGDSLIEPLGAMLLAATIVAIILSYAKQASLFAFIIIGICGGLFGLKEIINTNVMTAFVDVGITLLLFMTEIGKHTSELQSHSDLVCRLLLEKKKKKKKKTQTKQNKKKKQ